MDAVRHASNAQRMEDPAAARHRPRPLVAFHPPGTRRTHSAAWRGSVLVPVPQLGKRRCRTKALRNHDPRVGVEPLLRHLDKPRSGGAFCVPRPSRRRRGETGCARCSARQQAEVVGDGDERFVSAAGIYCCFPVSRFVVVPTRPIQALRAPHGAPRRAARGNTWR